MNSDYAANLAILLTENTGSCLGSWRGKLSAAKQRALFGRYLGKGTIWIAGADEIIEHYRKVCFGHDYETTFSCKWAAL